jgi:hypothetical protein
MPQLFPPQLFMPQLFMPQLFMPQLFMPQLFMPYYIHDLNNSHSLFYSQSIKIIHFLFFKFFLPNSYVQRRSNHSFCLLNTVYFILFLDIKSERIFNKIYTTNSDNSLVIWGLSNPLSFTISHTH